MCSSKPRAAFTLVELLVVVAIVGLLLAILIPSLAAARRQTERVVCASHLRQIGHGFIMYAEAHGGLAMPLAYTERRQPAVYWWGMITSEGVDYRAGFLRPYLPEEVKLDGVYNCPSQPWGSYVPQGTTRRDVTSTYGYNGYYLCPPYTPGWSETVGWRPWRNIDAIQDPGRLFAFADTMIVLGGQLKNNALLDPPLFFQGPRRWSVNPSPTTSFRHDGLTNALHVDGHAAAYHPNGGRITSAEFNIGSVRAENDPHYVPDWFEW